MEKSTAERTETYIDEHPFIKACLKKGIINYSALARLISDDLGIQNISSKEAILIAARRFERTLSKAVSHEEDIRILLSRSEIDIKNKMCVYILDKMLDKERFLKFEAVIKRENGTLFALEGSLNHTLIMQERYVSLLEKKFKKKILQKKKDLALISLTSPREIEKTVGVVSFLTSLFAENGVNLLEFLSCWQDTLFVIEKKDVMKAIEFLRF